MKLYYLGKPDDGFGWGVANTNLVRELSKLCEVVVDTSNRTQFDAPVFMPVVDESLAPQHRISAPRVLGYCFTEWPLTPDAARNARHYDVLFAGSTWNTEKLRRAGVQQAETLIQGVNFGRFTPRPPPDPKGFVVFSGGKYEFRKGQDYVLRAMRHFMLLHADVLLLAAWHNPWPQTMASMQQSRLIDCTNPWAGLPEDRVIKIPAIPNAETPEVYSSAHVGLFPNRCEAGTNMVMAEFMACSRPVIATDAHGHRDVLDGDGPLKLTNGTWDATGWFHPDVTDIRAHLEYAYQHRAELVPRGEQCRRLVERFTWADCAAKIVKAAFPTTAELAGPAVAARPWPIHETASSQPNQALLSLMASAEARRSATEFSAAENLYRQVLNQDADHAPAWYGLAQMAMTTRNFELAAQLLGKAIGSAPNEPGNYVDLGICLGAMNRGELAIQAQRKALQLAPENVPALTNLGKALGAQNQVTESIACLRQALHLAPGLAAAHWNLALALLVAGRLPEGWEEFEWRLQVNPHLDPKLSVPKWQGEPAPSQTILLCAEQGTGDCLQFLRYLPLVKARVGRVIVACPKSLVSLVKTAEGVDEAAPAPGPTLHCDRYAMMLSLPRIFGTSLNTIPATIPYLRAQSHFQPTTAQAKDPAGRRIGLVWAGNASHPNDANRSAPLAALSPLLALPGNQFFSLQVGPRATDLSQLADAAAITDWSSYLGDYSDTAAALATLDLLITVDTSVAHLAGALGRPVWLLLPFAPDWRWLLKREDTPWYPTMRLFRQPTPGDWKSVVAKLVEALQDGSH